MESVSELKKKTKADEDFKLECKKMSPEYLALFI